MSNKQPTPFENIRLVGVHKEPTFGPSPCGEVTALLDKANAENKRLRTAINTAIPMIRHDGDYVSTAEIQAINMLEHALKEVKP